MGLKIILIDDHDVTNYMHRQLLGRLAPEAEIQAFADTYKALDYLGRTAEREGGTFLVFLDINMPDLTGWEVIEAINRSMPEVDAKVVMLTASVRPEDKEKAFTYDRVTDFVSKPFTKDQALAILRKFPSLKIGQDPS